MNHISKTLLDEKHLKFFYLTIRKMCHLGIVISMFVFLTSSHNEFVDTAYNKRQFEFLKCKDHLHPNEVFLAACVHEPMRPTRLCKDYIRVLG